MIKRLGTILLVGCLLFVCFVSAASAHSGKKEKQTDYVKGDKIATAVYLSQPHKAKATLGEFHTLLPEHPKNIIVQNI